MTAPLAAELAAHQPFDGRERADLERMRAFAERKDEPFDREDPEGHFTGSAVVAGPSLDRVVLLRHRQLDMWLQPGGHAETGETCGIEVALREAREETGLAVAPHPVSPGLVDVDVHEIPARDGMPSHRHLDLRYLLVADPDESLDPPATEASKACWFAWDELEDLGLDEGLHRLLAKVQELRPSAARL